MELSEIGKKEYQETKRILYNAKNDKQLVLFVGAGISVDSGMPLWKDAINKISEKMQLTTDQNDPLKIPQYYYNSRGNKEYTQLMRVIFRYKECLKPTKLHKKLLDLNTSTIITTNYDHLIEKAAEENGEFIHVISQDIDLPYKNSKRELIKMHGDFEHNNFVLKEDDYLNYSYNFKLIETYVKSILGSKVVLFVGYSLNDPDVKQIISWVKDVLKDDFQRAYLIITKAKSNDIEKEYFRNLGVNLIYASDIVEDSDNISHSDQLIEVLNFINQKKEVSKLDSLYESLKPLDEMNYVYGKYIANAFNKYDMFCDEDNGIRFGINNGNESNNSLAKAIWNDAYKKVVTNNVCDDSEDIEFDNEKIATIIRVCEKSRYSKFIRENEKYEKIELNSVEQSKVELMVYKFDYEGLRKLVSENIKKISSDTPDLFMEQAYISSFLHEYANSYNYYKSAAKIYYKHKSYVKYFIAEFNRKNVGIIVTSTSIHGLTVKEKELINAEIEAINLDRILESIPNDGKEINVFLQELKNFTISYTLFYNVYVDSLKSNEQANTVYSLFAGTAAYENLRVKIRDFDRYETSNFIFLDNYYETKEIFDLYIRTIMSCVNSTDILVTYNDEPCGNISPDAMTEFDLYIALRYMSSNELKKYFKEYGIKHITISESAVEYLNEICKSICNESTNKINSIYDIDKFWSYLEIIGHTVVTPDMLSNVIERLMMIKNEDDILSHNEALNRFICNIIDEKMYCEKTAIKQVKKLMDAICNLIATKRINSRSMLGVISNLLFFIQQGSDRYDNTRMIKKIIKTNDKLILFNCYRYFGVRIQEAIIKEYSDWKPIQENVNDYCLYCDGVLSGIFDENADFEKEIINWIYSKQLQEKKEKPSIINLGGLKHSDVIKKLINLFLDDKIIDVEALERIIKDSEDEASKWLMDMEKYDYSKFDCSWLNLCQDGLIKKIVENDIVRKEILSAYKEQFNKLSEKSKVNEIIVKYFI